MKKKLVKFLGVTSILLGLSVIAVTLFLHFSYVDKMNELLKNRVIVDNSSRDTSEEQEVSNVESDIVGLTIEGMDSDQKIGKIKKGTPIITIPALDITVPVIKGTSKQSLRLGAGQFDCSAEMGDKGNFSVAGHSSTVYNCIFNDLEKIRLFDKIQCYNSKGDLFEYYVTGTFKTEPDSIEVLEQTDEPTMTIVTCTDRGTRRFIVTAKLMSGSELAYYIKNLKQVTIDNAISMSDDCSCLDLLEYFNSPVTIYKFPYRIHYCVNKDIKPFFTNYTVLKDKLNTNKNIIFKQSIGLEVSEV